MSDTHFDVAAVGNAIVDVIASTTDDQLVELGLNKGHMALIGGDDVARAYDRMGPAREISGGSAANTVVGIASLGGRAAFFGRIAADPFGEIFRHDIRAAGVTFETEAMEGGDPTARCLVFVSPDGERTMLTHLGISPQFSSTDIKEETIAGASALYLEGYLYDEPLAMDAFHRAADIARDAGRKVALTLSDAFCVDRHRDAFSSFIPNSVDILFANEAEILSLAQVDDIESALAQVAGMVDVLAVTRSEKGCVVMERGQTRIEVPTERSVDVVDTTGAGDLFAAGFLHGLTRGASLEVAARLGNLCAGEIIRNLGARPIHPLRALADEHGLSV